MYRSATSSRLFAGSITRPLRMMVAVMSGEHARLACWRARPRDRQLLFYAHNLGGGDTLAKPASARRQKSEPDSRKHARRVRSPGSRGLDFSCGNSPAQVEDSHANGEAVGDLIENDALQSVGNVAVDLDAAIDRAGMHDQAIRF